MSKLKQGTFITFEGGEGIGKSTQCQMLYEYLKSQNIPVILTREVGGTNVAEKMREILVHTDLLPMSELLQAMAARYDHMVKKIIPALQAGNIVICDRFIDSTACYQGLELENGIELVYNLHKDLMPPLMPDLTFFIDVESSIAIERVNSRNMSNKFDVRGLDFYNKIYDCFKGLSKKFPERIVTIKASDLNPEQVHELIKKHLNLI
ncbi:dTMP kinase [Rickettsia bellii]|uniref:Thymidylate kinase n=2 Tax=Rickettsia bellii TaxID=33990 RepID=KTHY_RICBR|nr:dTMP kinase [Rickettsia bellii]Q1RJZ6.1 RecName: Full=Thymidylate kinase; AltName: Full=dTMP kinase [Rickettsia bellii RML369-C]ABE04318.1 Thymidylate kinase [Rickettsia bellii RML369-C]KJV92341.1 thymidylate kinase [Rickettsia bellii str. RML Mogi]